LGSPFHCRDEHEVAADGTVVDTIEAAELGVVVAKATLRARFKESSAPAGDALSVETLC
jgi:hypothetical protein